MSTSDNANPSAAEPATVRPAAHKTRPFYWSVRREIWENRSIAVAPVAIAGVVLLGLAIGAIRLPHKFVLMLSALPPGKQAEAVSIPYGVVGVSVLLTAFIVAFFYCLGALHGERRDRTILFWKSLPVSDLTAVLAKAAIPLVVLPLVTFAVILVAELIVLAASLVLLPASGLPPALLWQAFPLPQAPLVLLYILVCNSLWQAPIWGWLLLISGWAKRVPILWAAGPPLALSLFERLAFGSAHLWTLLTDRLAGPFTEAFDSTINANGHSEVDLHLVDPMKFLSTLGLWIGLVLAAALIAATVWQRRYRSPI